MRKSNENFEIEKTKIRNDSEDRKRKLFENSEENNRIMEENARKKIEEINKYAEEQKKLLDSLFNNMGVTIKSENKKKL